MDYDALFRQQLDTLRQEGNYRVFAELERRSGDFPRARRFVGDRAVRRHRLVLERLPRHGPAPEGARRDARRDRRAAAPAPAAPATSPAPPTSTCCSSASSPTCTARRRRCSSPRGYVSNWATLGTLGARLPGAVILSDALNHASMIEGIRHARCEKRIWRHNDPRDLDRQLAEIDPDRPKIVAFESVYSMDGDIAPIAEIVEVAERARRDDLPRRGARGRPLRPARRRRRRGARADGPHHPDRGHARQGLRRRRRLHRRLRAR